MSTEKINKEKEETTDEGISKILNEEINYGIIAF